MNQSIDGVPVNQPTILPLLGPRQCYSTGHVESKIEGEREGDLAHLSPGLLKQRGGGKVNSPSTKRVAVVYDKVNSGMSECGGNLS